MRCFGYLRVSGKGQVEGDGFPRQRVSIEAYCAANGLEIVQWFEEKAITGKTEWEDRPAWMEMMLALNGVQTVVIESLNRLARDLMVQEHVIDDLRKRQVKLISVAEPDLCTDDPSRKLLRQIMGAIAEYDRAMIVLKLRGARCRKRNSEGKCEGPKLYGDKPGEDQVLHRMQSMRQSGSTFSVIAETLNDQGLKTRKSLRWSPGTVCKILGRVAA